MADNVTSIGSDGGDTYSSVAAWEAGTDNDLSAATGSSTREIGEMRGEEFTDAVTFFGATTDVNFYRWLRSMDGHEFDHTDKSGARTVVTGTTTMFTSSDDYFRFGGSEGASSGSVGLKFTNTATSVRNCFNSNSTGSNGAIVKQIVCYDCTAANPGGDIYPFIASDVATFYNCLIFNIDADDRVRGFTCVTASDLTAYNCVAYDCTGATGYGFYRGFFYNCYAGACTTKTFNGSDGNYNGADNTDTSVFTNNLQSKAGANQFQSVSGGSEDFHLKTGADLIDAGNDAYGNDFDIDGAFAGTRDDMGVHEFVAAPGGYIPFPRPRGMRAGLSKLVGGMH